ncbi:MAG: Ig-like domain-containing protein [Bacillota bacterium]
MPLNAPYVMFSEPKMLAEDVDPAKPVVVWFNRDLDPGTVSAATVRLLDLTNRVPVSGEVIYTGRQVTFRPDRPLAPESRHQLVVLGGESGVKDILGTAMAQTFTLEFVTGALTGAVVPVVISPAEQEAVAPTFTILWTAVGEGFYEVQVASDLDFTKVVWPLDGEGYTTVFSEDGSFASVVPARPLEPGYYFVRVRMSGEAWSRPVGFAVYVREEPLVAENVVDELKVVNMLPSPFSGNVSLDIGKIVLEFNRELDPQSVSSKSVYVVKLPG